MATSKPTSLVNYFSLKLVLPLGLEPRHCANQAQGLHYRIGASEIGATCRT
jgi:hypothetical protein